jgi:hypothetical protein
MPHEASRCASASDLTSVADALHQTSNRVHEYGAHLAVLKQRADDTGARLMHHDQIHSALREDIDARELRIREYTDAQIQVVRGAIKELGQTLMETSRESMRGLRDEWTRMRTEEAAIKRDQETRAMWRIGLLVTVVSIAAPLLLTAAQMLLAKKA